MPIATINGRRVLFIHIPKTGGTSVTQWMQSKARVRLHSDQRPGSLLVSPQHLTFADIETMWGSDDFDYMFTLVRDPFSRMESEFRMRDRLRGKGFFGGQLSFPSWLERSLLDARANPNHMDNHLRPQWHFLSDKLKTFRFEDGIDQVLATISADLELPPPASVPHALSTGRMAGAFPWDCADVLRMREHYALDFETLGYAQEPVRSDAPAAAPAGAVSPVVATPAVATPAVATPAVATPAVATPVVATVDARSCGPAATAPAAELVRKYTSLGDNCEFGFVQRHHGHEDGSLLRWAITFPEVLAANIRNGFDGIFQFDNIVPYSGKMVQDLASGIKFHSAMLSDGGHFIASEHERREIHAGEAKKIGYLRDKLVAALADPRSVFVYKHNDGVGDETVQGLVAAMQGWGDARLMVVRDGGAPSIRQAGAKLYLAQIPRFAKYSQASEPDIEAWTELLRLADPVLFGKPND